MQKEFVKSQGPFVKGLDKALDSFNVHRQAYYSGTFVGNHVHADKNLFAQQGKLCICMDH